MDKLTSNRIYVMDLVRIAAVSLVIFGHLFQKYYNPLGNFFGFKNFYYVSIGGVGVTLLIILSGFVLEYNKAASRRYLEFLKKRVLRIYPTYWMAIIIALFFGAHFSSSIKLFFLDITGFLSFTGMAWRTYALPTGWFIGVIITLYLLYPLFSELIKRNNDRILWLLLFFLVVEVVFRYYLGRYYPTNRSLDWFPLARTFEFGIGVYLGSALGAKVKSMNRYIDASLARVILFVSALSFPAYLIHYVFLNLNISSPVGFLLVFIILTTTFSYLLFYLDKRIKTPIMYPVKEKVLSNAKN